MTAGMNRSGLALITGFIIILLSSCDLTSKYEKQEQADIQNYLDNNPNLKFEKKQSGLYYLDVVKGTGDSVAIHDTAHVLYTGYTLDGTQFITNYGTGKDTLVVPVGEGYMNILAGFDEALTYMRGGGKCKALMPSSLAYGSSGLNFPAFTPVVFDIYIQKLVRGPGHKK